MATFIEIRTDAFAKNLADVKADLKKVGGLDGVRRPLRGIEIKNDTYATMKVIRSDGTVIPLVDAGGSDDPVAGNDTPAGSNVVPQTRSTTSGPTSANYSNFIIQAVVDSRQEKQQIMETFGESYIFFFGERPRVLNVQGVLFNTLDFNWRTEFWYNYERTLRGTKLVEQNARVYLHWDDIVVEGYITGAQAQDDAMSPYHIPFSFTMFVTNHTYLSQIGSEAYPIRNATFIEPLQNAKSAADFSGDLKSELAQARKASQAVARAAEGAAQPRVSTQEVIGALEVAGQPSSFNVGKNLLANTIAIGVQAQNLTFLSLVNRFFTQRKMRFPRGIAGAESNSGPPQLQGLRSSDIQVKRTKSLRSKISDNWDEYVVRNRTLQEGYDYVKSSQNRMEKVPDKYALEGIALATLQSLGINPVQHGKPAQKSPFDQSNSFTVTSGPPLGSGFTSAAVDLGFTL